MTYKINKKAFDLYVKSTKAFSLFIEGLTASDSWTLLIKQFNTITASLNLQLRPLLSIINNGAILQFGIAKLIQYITVTIASSISVAITVSETLGFSNTFVSEFLLAITLRLRSTISTTIDNQVFTATFVPLLAQLYALSVWDAETLATMDVEALEDLDFATV